MVDRTLGTTGATKHSHQAHFKEARRRGLLARARAAWPWFPLLPVSMWLTFQYRWVLDDAFIYFRYAENFAQTGQLVFNVGEYVEGFTSPLWMVLLAATRTMGLPFWPVILLVSFASVLVFFVLLVKANDALSPVDGPAQRVYLPLALLTTNYAVLSHFGSGMETPLVQVCGVAFVYLIACPSSRSAQIWMALAPVIRPELTLPFAVAIAWSWWKCHRFPKVLGFLGGVLGLGWLLFRIGYYGDAFPNTYYLKEGDHWRRGVTYVADTVGQYHFHVWLIALFAGTLFIALRSRRDARLLPRVVIWGTAGIVTLHVIRIGGDFVHYRYLAFPMCALVASFGGVAESLCWRIPRVGALVGAGITLAAAVLMATAYPRRQLPTHPVLLERHNLTIGVGLSSYARDGIEDSMRHRSVDMLDPTLWDAPTGKKPVPPVYAELFYTAWCEAAYDRMDLYTIHSLGLTSAVLARLPVPETAQAGHKWTLLGYAAGLASVWAAGTTRTASSTMRFRIHPRRGAFRVAVDSGRAPNWVRNNLRALEVIEEKSYGKNDFRRSLRLAFTRMPFVL